ncbi:clustered mitochondria protein [Hordeum vulgare]|nr:clustered mitochondria protein [Hordeum vulgare]
MHATVIGRHRFVPPALGRVRSSAARRLPRGEELRIPTSATSFHAASVLQAPLRALGGVSFVAARCSSSSSSSVAATAYDHVTFVKEIAVTDPHDLDVLQARVVHKLSPGDNVIDVKQFLLDAPETCFYTCYDLILHTKDSSTHQLEDYNEISEIADISAGGCSLEMVAGPDNMEHLKRITEEMQKQVAAAGAI